MQNKTVILRGPLLTQSGYGTHARQLVRYLLKKENLKLHFDLTPWGDTPWCLREDMFDGLVGKILAHNEKLDGKADVALSLQLPNEWDRSLAHVNVGLSAVVETDRCNPQWVEAVNKMDTVIVPSNHAKAALENTGPITTPLFVVPEAYDSSLVDAPAADVFSFSTKFNFLIVGQLTGDKAATDRKNIYMAIRWIFETFKDNPDVGVVVKTNSGHNTQLDRERTNKIFQALMKECRSGEFPKLHVVHGDLSSSQMNALYKHESIKAYVSLTKGEGFGLPTLEAAVAGLPVIATNWSGHLDFLNKGKFISVSYTLRDVDKTKIDNHIFMAGSRWAEADEIDFKKKIKRFYESSDVPKSWALDLQEKLKSTHSQESIEKAYDEKIGKYFV